MKPCFHSGKVTLVICLFDLHSGYEKLAAICLTTLGIDVSLGKDYVVFISKGGAMAKVIFCDKCGSTLITRRLHQGKFLRLLARAQGAATEPLTVEELCRYLDGEPLQIKRQGLLKN